MTIPHVALLLGALSPGSPTEARFQVADRGEGPRVEVVSEGQILLHSPGEGLWSIATDWQDRWPADWHHVHPSDVHQAGPWTVLTGRLDLSDGYWELRDAYREYGRLVQCVRRYTWKGSAKTSRVTLSARWIVPARSVQAILPGILYYGNPSGAASGRVPVFSGKPGEEAVFEEHRYPVPLACLEWVEDDARWGAALHTVPTPAAYGHLPDQWWSLGVVSHEKSAELTLLSGPCASNGQRSVIKAIQPGFVPYDEAYLEVAPEARIEKTFFLDLFPVEREGAAIARPLRSSLDLFRPFDHGPMPSFSEIIEAKYRFAKSRWHAGDASAGFKKYPDRDYYVMGWCGQAAAPGYALQVLAEILDDPAAFTMAQESLDFLATAEFFPGGFHTWYDFSKRQWSHDEPLSQGQAMLNFANAIRVGRNARRATGRWETFLKKACDFHAQRILRSNWRPRSTDQAFFIAPLCRAAQLFDNDTYKMAAIKAAEHYAARHLTMREPYWGGTLDARCEDKEGAFAALQGFLAVYEITGDDRVLAWARHACDVVLTYLVVWDIDLPPGRLRNHGFKTRGWTVVSPQNQHIDAYGVLIAPEIYRLGQILARDDLKQIAVLMFRSCGQLIDPYGSQGEQPQHTNYAQRGSVSDLHALRGGYAEDWTVFWITAHFLNAAAQLQELGVKITDTAANAGRAVHDSGGKLSD